MSLRVEPVQTAKQLDKFVKLPWKIYKDDPNWVPPLISEQKKFLKKSPFFEFGDAQYFLAFKDGEPVGRISAHTSGQYEKYHDDYTGFFGFFECINDQDIASALFEHAQEWLKLKGKKRVLGPQSFTLYDESGMLFKGFDSLPVVMLSYNPQYYNDLLVNAGLQKSIDWFAFMVRADLQIKPSFFKIRDRVLKQTQIRLENLNLKNLDDAIEKVGIIFNSAWDENWAHVPLTQRQLETMAEELKLVAVEELSFFAYYGDECVGFCLTLKDANPALQKANGRLFPFGLFKIIREMKKIKRLRTIAMGVLKEYRHKGLEIAFYLEGIERGLKLGYTESECSIIVETNKRMIGSLEELDADPYKTYRFYEKEI